MRFKEEFFNRFKSGDSITVTLPKYCTLGEYARISPQNISRKYIIGKTNLNDSHGQVELHVGDKTMIVEYQWFDEKLTGRKIILTKV